VRSKEHHRGSFGGKRAGTMVSEHFWQDLQAAKEVKPEEREGKLKAERKGRRIGTAGGPSVKHIPLSVAKDGGRHVLSGPKKENQGESTPKNRKFTGYETK